MNHEVRLPLHSLRCRRVSALGRRLSCEERRHLWNCPSSEAPRGVSARSVRHWSRSWRGSSRARVLMSAVSRSSDTATDNDCASSLHMAFRSCYYPFPGSRSGPITGTGRLMRPSPNGDLAVPRDQIPGRWCRAAALPTWRHLRCSALVLLASDTLCACARTGPRKNTSTGRAQRSLVDGRGSESSFLGSRSLEENFAGAKGRSRLGGRFSTEAAQQRLPQIPKLRSFWRRAGQRNASKRRRLREIAVSIPFLTGFVLRLRMTTRTRQAPLLHPSDSFLSTSAVSKGIRPRCKS